MATRSMRYLLCCDENGVFQCVLSWRSRYLSSSTFLCDLDIRSKSSSRISNQADVVSRVIYNVKLKKLSSDCWYLWSSRFFFLACLNWGVKKFSSRIKYEYFCNHLRIWNGILLNIVALLKWYQIWSLYRAWLIKKNGLVKLTLCALVLLKISCKITKKAC